jgi:hypothetical protein
MCHSTSPTVPSEDWLHIECTDKKVIAKWESGNQANYRSNVFCHDDAIVFHLACVAFANSPGEVHFITKKGKVQQGGWQSYFACNGQFVGFNTAHVECDLARGVIQKMH